MNRNIRHQERGAVALITAMIVSILLMITTAGMVSLTLKSLRQSTDGAQSTKAYYAAEGGLEEALLKIRNNQDPNSCTGAAGAGSQAEGVITCTKVSTVANELTGDVGLDKTIQLDLSSVVGMKSIKLEWGVDGYDANSIPNYYTSTGQNQFPAKTAWPASAPPVMELGIVRYPGTDPFSIDQVGFYEQVIGPQSKKTGAAPISNGFNTISSYGGGLGKPFIVACNGTGQYQCSAGIAGLGDGNRFVMRLKTRYNAAHYRITVQDANNAAIAIPGAVYTIDVTARAGDVFRRIQTSFPVGQNAPKAIDGLDYVLYSDTDICKAFEIKGGVASGVNGCQAP